MTSITNPCDTKFAWVMKNFSSLQLQDCYVSVPVLIRDVKWRLFVYPEENNGDHLSLYLQVDFESMPCGWRQYTQFHLTVVNQLSEQFSVKTGTVEMLQKGESGLIRKLRNGVMIVAEVETFEAISTSQVAKISDDSEWTVLEYYSSSEEDKDDVTLVVKGFHVLESQVNQVKEMFEKHPDLASNFNFKNQNLKNVYMGILLDLIKTLSKSPKELTGQYTF
ncbi:PREDICTED: MATH domain and coiled-coil domain-containing protein At3g58280-like isoform X2 [Camelina sativa]|uniref:MATH domain and coiled-coil domain-containing protein At3g58280-like isoform X2 n=1 Tax=Camelina sativa TaxID=90675 RepID=A0ABM1RLQ5_CAMSA|nr:PREDICTED: MATH domain and coiled-coil domain-containing protein At3g58280-like isoform X2 [Camelina sativa]